ncbi:hypothetical protein HP15_621 [Marinobacter adhaerens HP15]|uniref:Uncharacterized protein n=1 Tax=Marinobacter adhaerens (strain DSM 23420 / HP15) TaxID=225937 RepID=E4PP73_MARAH|nr:hypothetical protein HP15_621 [Marinobacter adhaerens HP15]
MCCGSPAILEMREDKFPALNRIIVFLGLTAGVRIPVVFLPGNHSDPCPEAAPTRHSIDSFATSITLGWRSCLSTCPE